MRAPAESRSPRAAALARLGCLLWALAVSTGVRASDDVDRQRALRAHLEALGARVGSPPVRLFLQQDESVVRRERVTAGCTGFLAYGSGNVRDVDLSMMAAGGLLLDEDALVAPYGYVRVCASEAMDVFVHVRLYAGRGELRLVRVEDAPSGLGLLPEVLGLAPPSSGRPERPRPVGPALPPRDLNERLDASDAVWLRRGYVPAGAPRSVPVAGGLARARMPLEQGLCYAVIVHSEPSRQTAVAVLDATGRRWAGSFRGSSAELYVCPRSTEEHDLLMRAEPGGALAHVRAYVQMEAGRHALPEGASDRAVAWAGEVTSRLEARGMRASVLGAGWVDSVGSLHWPLTLRAGHCYAHAAVVLAPATRATLTLALESPEGQLLARFKSRERWPRVYHCPERTGTYQLVLEARGEVGKVVLLQGVHALGRGGHSDVAH